MATLAEIRNARVKYLRELKPLYRALDGKIEAAERELTRIISRKRAFPEAGDLASLAKLTGDITTALNLVVSGLGRGYPQ